jgi:hypothetical protein
MSIRAELEELGKWISELSAKRGPAPTPQPLPREDWQAVDKDLRRASGKFADARDALLGKHRESFLAEFAGDLKRETEGLALRAHLLSRRAPRKPRPESTTPKPQPATDAATIGEKARGEPHDEVTEKKHRDHRASLQSPAELVKSAADTIEAAHEKLGTVQHPDALSKSFEEELDVLAEMTLSLRQRLEEERRNTGVER